MLALSCALASTLLVGSARAQPGGGSLTARRVVEVQVAGGKADGAGLDDTVRELLGRLSLVTESQIVARIDPDDAAFRATARPSLLARVGIDLRNDDVAEITIVDGRTGGPEQRAGPAEIALQDGGGHPRQPRRSGGDGVRVLHVPTGTRAEQRVFA